MNFQVGHRATSFSIEQLLFFQHYIYGHYLTSRVNLSTHGRLAIQGQLHRMVINARFGAWGLISFNVFDHSRSGQRIVHLTRLTYRFRAIGFQRRRVRGGRVKEGLFGLFRHFFAIVDHVRIVTFLNRIRLSSI